MPFYRSPLHKRSRSDAEENARVEPKRRVVHDADERIAVRKDLMYLADRGDLPIQRFLGQVYDAPNVIALDIRIDERELSDVRSLTTSAMRRLKGLLRGTVQVDGIHHVRLRVVAVIG